jgi:SAM-dependent methyltransferase
MMGVRSTPCTVKPINTQADTVADMSSAQPHGAHRHGHAAFDDERMARLIATEGESALPITTAAIERIKQAVRTTPARDVHRIAALGCGPGVEACALAEAFPSATVAAIDGSATMRAATQVRAVNAGVADRVQLAAIDLEDDLATVGSCDVVWTAQTLHHLTNEAAAVRRFAALLPSGGVLCVLERLAPAELHPASDGGRSGVWERVASAQADWYSGRVAHASTSGIDRYAALVADAGVTVIEATALHGTATLPASAGADEFIVRYARGALHNFAERLAVDDVAVLRGFVDDPSALRCPVDVHQSRILVIARAATAKPPRD